MPRERRRLPTLSPRPPGVARALVREIGVGFRPAPFVDKIPKVIGFKDHSTLWVSIADPEGLAAAIGK